MESVVCEKALPKLERNPTVLMPLAGLDDVE